MFVASDVQDYDSSSSIPEVTELSTLNNRLIKDKSLSIVNISTFSTPEQRKFKGDNDKIVNAVFKRVRQYESDFGRFELKELPLLPAVEASKDDPVFVVNNPFFTRNRTLNDIRRKCRIEEPHCIPKFYFVPLRQHNLTTNGLRKLTELLSTLAKRYSEGLNQTVQLVPLVLSRRVISNSHKNISAGPSTRLTKKYQLNVGVAVVAPEEDGYRPLSAVVLRLKRKILVPPGPGEDYPPDYVEYDDDIINYPFPEEE